MKVYPKYKSSGVIWVKQLPEDWSELRVKYFAIFRNGYSFKGTDFFENQEYPVVRIGDLENGRINLENTMKVSSKIYEETKKFVNKKGDILLALTGATIGKSAIYDTNKISLLNQRVAALRPNKKADIKFLKYLIESPEFLTFIDFECYGGAQENIGKGQITSAKFPIPSLAEQQKIVDFLDYKTGQCNRFIANRQKQIELLNEQKAAIINKAVTKGINPNAKMKPSGIEWLPEVPETWEVWKMKFLSRIETGNKNTEDAEEDGEYPFYVRSDKVEKISSYSFEGEAILTAGDGVGVAKVYHYANGKMAIHQRVYKISNFNKRISGEFLYYYIKDNFEKEVIKLSAKTTVDSLRMPMLANFLVAHPSQQEQQKILDYIKAEILKIETLISKYQKQIDLMQEYRTTLISQAVTGKIDVRDWQLPHN
jgi:type I restriction enzyme S subunit